MYFGEGLWGGEKGWLRASVVQSLRFGCGCAALGFMRVYLDMCALKRPFDDQNQGRIWIETQAVIRILEAASAGVCETCNSVALVFENELNPNPDRKQKVAEMLRAIGSASTATEHVFHRAGEMRELGFKDMDALHLAFAENLDAVYFVTCNDGLLRKARNTRLRVQVVDAVTFVKEMNL